ncbi:MULTISPECIES: hypothetical protein [Enterobacteriaceae]|uniref:hypothetical protein n=1 Tax=Enterobacteriaceae TaxID=543 RepID=UPI0028AD71C2|nr:hypothetical protein [Atlantibacter hermannii]
MPLTTEQGLEILISWLQDNIYCGTEIIFDNEDKTDSATLLPCIEQALSDVRNMRHPQRLRAPQ